MPLVTWKKRVGSDSKIFLTFDDGPTPEVTAQLLRILKQYKAKATFFCLGANIEKYPDRFAEMVDEGHQLANHSHSHPNGWKTGAQSYVDDVLRCQESLVKLLGYSPKLFRPPYGRISFRQLMALRRRFEVVMWDILSLDYRQELTGVDVADNVKGNAKSGSIVVMHDSELARERVVAALPLILQHFSERGYQMCKLDEC